MLAGAPAHNSLVVKEWLSEVFPNHVIAPNHDVEWPPRSPDLTPCDFFLWGYIKCNVYNTPPASIEDLKQSIIRIFDSLKRDPFMIRRSICQLYHIIPSFFYIKRAHLYIYFHFSLST